MHPKDSMEKAVALKAVAEKAKELESKGADNVDIANFIVGAKGELANQKPDPEKYVQAATSAAKWARTNIWLTVNK